MLLRKFVEMAEKRKLDAQMKEMGKLKIEKERLVYETKRDRATKGAEVPIERKRNND